jgi:hypothetical protein
VTRSAHKRRRKTARLRITTTGAGSSVLGILPDNIGSDELTYLNEGIHFLFHELREAAELHRSGINGGRDGVSHAVRTVTAFLMLFRTVNNEGLQAPLALLADALEALNSNLIEPMMKPVTRSGRAPASAGRQSMKGVVAYVVRRLQDIGINRELACRDAAAQLLACGVGPDRGSGKITARTVREWCDATGADVGRRSHAAQTFDGLFADLQNMEIDALLPNKARRLLLDRLANVARRMRANDTK